MKRVFKIPDGKIISRNRGIFDISMDWYHSQCCAAPSFSSGKLRTVYHQSAADYWAFSDLNDERFDPPETSPAFIFGRAAHALLLGVEEFDTAFAIVPKDAPPAPTAAMVNARNNDRISDTAALRFEFWDPFNADHKGKDYLKMGDLEHIKHIADALSKNVVAQILMTGHRERSLIWKDEKTGFYLKNRLDILSATGDFADLKTTRQRDLPLLYRDIRKLGYDMQMGLGTMAAEKVLDVPFDAEVYEGSRSAILIAIYNKPPYHIMPIELDFDALYWGRIKCRAALDTLHKSITEDDWAGPVEGIPVYTADYEITDLAEKQAAGLLPKSAY